MTNKINADDDDDRKQKLSYFRLKTKF